MLNTVHYACKDINNFGDILSLWLCEKLTDRKFEFTPEKNLFISGSILQEATPETIVMGAGFGSLFQKTNSNNIHYVRGWLTKSMLTIYNTKNKASVFEPSYCLREFFTDKKPTHEYGYLPHYVDNDLNLYPNDENYYKINILSGVESVVNSILDCKFIITSSLHGMAVADLFNRKSCLIKPINHVDTDGFKYIDYFSFIDREPYKPLFYNDKNGINEVLNMPALNFKQNGMVKNYITILRNILS